MSTSTLTDYTDQLAGLDPSSFIGVSLYFEFNQPRVTRADLEAHFLDLDLNDDFIPPPLNPTDAYKRATGADARYKIENEQGQRTEYFVRDVDHDDDRIIRHIVREVRDSKGKRLEYDEVGEAIFYRASRTPGGGHSILFKVHESDLSTWEQERVREFIDRMNNAFHFFTQFYYTQAIRDMIRKYIESLNAVPMRRGGAIYFVHVSRWDTIIKLVELVNDRIGYGCRLHMMPLIDTGYQRSMLSEAFQDEVEKQSDKLLGQIASLNEKYGGKKVPANKYAKIQAEWQDLTDRSEEYSRIFNRRQERSATALEMALDAVMEMATRIDHGDKS